MQEEEPVFCRMDATSLIIYCLIPGTGMDCMAMGVVVLEQLLNFSPPPTCKQSAYWADSVFCVIYFLVLLLSVKINCRHFISALLLHLLQKKKRQHTLYLKCCLSANYTNIACLHMI